MEFDNETSVRMNSIDEFKQEPQDEDNQEFNIQTYERINGYIFESPEMNFEGNYVKPEPDFENKQPTENSLIQTDGGHFDCDSEIKIEEMDVKAVCLKTEIKESIEYCNLQHINKDYDKLQSQENDSGSEQCETEFVIKNSKNDDEIEDKLDESELNPYVCKVCNRSFKFRSLFTRHQLYHTGTKPYVCDVCNKRFTVGDHLKRHERIHTGEKPYICDVCNRGFNDNAHLIRHKRTHTGEKPYACKMCNKTFTDTSQLKLHVRSHTGEKPYVCDVCNMGFKLRYQLKKHENTHTGIKPFCCDMCNKSFTSNHNLMFHKRTHTNERPFVCDVCNKSFIDKYSLKLHIRTHTNERPFVCDICNQGFTRLSNLVGHKKRIHRDKQLSSPNLEILDI